MSKILTNSEATGPNLSDGDAKFYELSREAKVTTIVATASASSLRWVLKRKRKKKLHVLIPENPV